MMEGKSRISRRSFVVGTGLATAAPFIWTRRSSAAGKVVIRTIGGSYEEATVKVTFEPFTKATGIEVVKVPATLGKVLAMHEAGNMELDVMDAGELGVLSLSQKGALDKHGADFPGRSTGDVDELKKLVGRAPLEPLRDVVGNRQGRAIQLIPKGPCGLERFIFKKLLSVFVELRSLLPDRKIFESLIGHDDFGFKPFGRIMTSR